ncbi:MAG: DUF2142 domain-containing protein [Bacteroidetes bacterium]|nr:DUF2142 domain-containing protein [Bacteroidota bacterium]
MLNLLNKIKPWNFFVFAAIVFEIVFTSVTPPLQAPDEFNHFYRAYQVSDGQFLPERTSNRLGGEIPVCFNDFMVPYFYAATNLKYVLYGLEVEESGDVRFNDSITEFKDFPNTAYYSPVSYAPQAFAMFIVKQFNCSVSSVYYAGRIGGFLFWLIIMFLVIKIVPVYKWLFTTLILLPMNLYVTNSLSADTVTNCLGLLFISLTLKYAFAENKLTKAQLFLLLIIILLIAMAKVVYVGAIVLLFIIPANKFANKLWQYGSIAIMFILSFIVVYAWSETIMKFYITYTEYDPKHNFYIGLSSCGNYNAQKAYILEHGFYFFTVIYNSIFRHPEQFLIGYVGAFGQSDIAMKNIVYIISYIFILFLAVTESNKFILGLRQKIIIFIAAFGSFVLLLLSQHLIWDCVGEGIVDMVQGRYLIPIFPLLFILFNNSKIKIKPTPLLFVLPFVFVINLYAARKIFYRFYVESYTSKTEFFCGFEQKDSLGNFITSNPEIKLGSAAMQVKDTSFTGKYCAYLPPPSRYDLQFGFNYKFKNLKAGDMIEIDARQKGVGGSLVIAGKGKNCNEFFFASNAHSLAEINGWNKIYSVFTMTEKCDSSDVTFFMWNPSDKKVYFDHINFRIKKYDKGY